MGYLQTFQIEIFLISPKFRSSSTHIYPPQKNVRGNVAAVEPYNHIPSSSTTSGQQQHQQQIVQDLAMLKLKAPKDQQHSPIGSNLMGSESDESKIARQKKQHEIEVQSTSHVPLMTVSHPASSPSSTTSSSTTNASEVKKGEQWPKMSNQTMPSKLVANSSLNVGNTSLLSHKIISSVLAASNQANSSTTTKQSECDNEKASENDMSSTQIASSTQINALNKAIAEPVAEEKPAIKPKALHQIPSGNLVVPPRKPVSSVAPTSITLAPKSISQTPKIQMVAPNNNIQAPVLSTGENDKSRPALPPKPMKSINNNGQPLCSNENENSNADTNNLPIKAKPLTIKKQPLSEQPRLRSLTSNQKLPQYSTSRRIEMPPSFLFPEIVTVDLKDNTEDINGNSTSSTSIISKLMNGNINLNTINSNGNQDNGSVTSADETDKSITPIQDENQRPNITDSVVRRKRNLIGENAKAKLARRVSFDPLALLLDASLEGELELVKKTCAQVPNPSAANDEGITALHNAICAGHFEIVK